MSGVSDAGLRTIGLPQASAGATFQRGDQQREVPRHDQGARPRPARAARRRGPGPAPARPGRSACWPRRRSTRRCRPPRRPPSGRRRSGGRRRGPRRRRSSSARSRSSSATSASTRPRSVAFVRAHAPRPSANAAWATATRGVDVGRTGLGDRRRAAHRWTGRRRRTSRRRRRRRRSPPTISSSVMAARPSRSSGRGRTRHRAGGTGARHHTAATPGRSGDRGPTSMRAGVAMGRLDGKVALITGAGGGMGRVAAELFAAEGARVAVVDLAERRRGRRRRSRRPAGEAIAVAADVTDGAVGRGGGRRHGRGLRRPARPLQQRRGQPRRRRRRRSTTAESTWDTTMDVNVKGVWLCCKARHPGDARQRRRLDHQRRVVRRPPRRGHPAARVHHVEGRGAGDDPRDRGRSTPGRASGPTRCAPGPVLTPLLAKYLSDDEKRQRRLVHIPMGRFGEAEEMVQRRAVPRLRRLVVHDRPVAR